MFASAINTQKYIARILNAKTAPRGDQLSAAVVEALVEVAEFVSRPSPYDIKRDEQSGRWALVHKKTGRVLEP